MCPIYTRFLFYKSTKLQLHSICLLEDPLLYTQNFVDFILTSSIKIILYLHNLIRALPCPISYKSVPQLDRISRAQRLHCSCFMRGFFVKKEFNCMFSIQFKRGWHCFFLCSYTFPFPLFVLFTFFLCTFCSSIKEYWTSFEILYP